MKNILAHISFKKVAFIAAPLILLIFTLFPEIFDKDKPVIAYTAGVALLMAIWWMTEVIPLAVTALLPVALFPLYGIMNGKAVTATYFNHLIFLFIGGFLIALAMEKWHLHRRIALRLLLLIGLSPARILLGFMLTTAFLSMWISNTATTMMMVPILLSIVAKMEEINTSEGIKKMEKGLLLGIAYAASIGGIATLIGTPPNLSFVRIFSIFFPEAPEISFAQWMVFALPLSVLLLTITYFYLYAIFFKNSKESFSVGKNVISKEYQSLGKMSYEEKWVLTLFVSLALLWLFRKPIHFGLFSTPGWSNLFAQPKWITDGNVAIFIGVLLFIIPSKDKQKSSFLMDWHTAERIPWGIILLFGGGFALASGFKESGLSSYIGDSLSHLQNIHPLLILLLIVVTITFLTELTSNTATTETFLPILAAMAVAMAIHPLFLMIPATIAASFAFMLPVATPPNAIVFGSKKLQISDMIRTGFWLNFIGTLLLTLVAYFYMSLVFDIDFSQLPVWVK
jgi:sodium-dependent dicarboxylate transporter 2/3/5